MMNILIAIPIYCREDYAYNCAMSLIKNTQIPGNMRVTVVFGINKANDDLKRKLSDLVTSDQTDRRAIKVIDFGENIGKASAVNRIAKSFPFDYLVSLDGDMICIQPDWLINMVGIYNMCRETKSPLGALCGNQFGGCCHAINVNDRDALRIELGRFTLIGHRRNIGVAGGILMTPVDVWNRIGGYDSTKLYGGDDGYYSIQCMMHRLRIMYVREVGFYHPYDLNDGYSKWKVDHIQASTQANNDLVTTGTVGYFG